MNKACKIISDIIEELRISEVYSAIARSVKLAATLVGHNIGLILVLQDEHLKAIFTERGAIRMFVATRRNLDQSNLADMIPSYPKSISAGASP